MSMGCPLDPGRPGPDARSGSSSRCRSRRSSNGQAPAASCRCCRSTSASTGPRLPSSAWPCRHSSSRRCSCSTRSVACRTGSGRRPIQIGGLLTYSAASAAFALIGTPIAALFVRSMQGVGAGVVDVANNATVGEVVPQRHQGRAYGAVFGARTDGSVDRADPGWRRRPRAHALAVPRRRVRIPARLRAHSPRRAEGPLTRHACRRPEVVLWRNRSVLGVALGYGANGVIIGVYEVCWSLLLHLKGASAWQIGFSWTLFAIPFAAMSLPGGWLVDHLDRRYLAAGATLLSAGFAATYPFIHSIWLLIGLGSLEAATVAVAAPALAAQLAHSVPARQLGRAPGRRLDGPDRRDRDRGPDRRRVVRPPAVAAFRERVDRGGRAPGDTRHLLARRPGSRCPPEPFLGIWRARADARVGRGNAARRRPRRPDRAGSGRNRLSGRVDRLAGRVSDEHAGRSDLPVGGSRGPDVGRGAEREASCNAEPSEQVAQLRWGREVLVLVGGVDDLDALPRERAARASSSTSHSGAEAPAVTPTTPARSSGTSLGALTRRTRRAAGSRRRPSPAPRCSRSSPSRARSWRHNAAARALTAVWRLVVA